jgi:nitroreductase
MQLNTAIQNRWSPLSFSEKQVPDKTLELMFEAARWAPSSRNAQPWQYYYARKGEKYFNKILNLLTGNNPDWAKNAQVLIISVLKKKLEYKNRPNGKALHDLGAASALMAVQASDMGLQVHQMGGFDKQKATELLNLDTENFDPVTCIAVGFPGNSENLPEDLRNGELQPRLRKEKNEFVFKL